MDCATHFEQNFINWNEITKIAFIGLALLLPYCPVVHFIEYIPSTRLNGRCHYYSKEVNITFFLLIRN